MLSRLVAAAFAVALAASAQSRPPESEPKPNAHPSPEQQAAIIEDVREYALNYSQNLPDYICTQVIQRYGERIPQGKHAPVGGGPLLDTLTIRLTYFEQKENYRLLLVNNTVTQQDYSKLGGMTSAGDFGTMMRQIFELATEAQFQWARSEKLRGRLVYVFAYHVAQARSRWHIDYQDREDLVPAYRGFVHVDPQTRQVLRLSLQAIDIPRGYPVLDSQTTLDYDYQVLGDQRFLLPLKGEVLVVGEDFWTRNDNEFRQYHKYSSDSAINYDTDPPAPDGQPIKEPRD